MAEESLAVASQAERAAVGRSRSPWWFYPVTGAVFGAVCVVFLLFPGIPAGLALIASVIASRLLEGRRLRVTGTRRSEFGGRAGIYSVLAIVALIATLGVGMLLVFQLQLTWTAWLVGVAIFLITVAHGWLVERATGRKS